MFSMLAAIQDDGLTIAEVVSNVPHDGPAIFVYILLGLFIGFIWHGSRKPSA